MDRFSCTGVVARGILMTEFIRKIKPSRPIKARRREPNLPSLYFARALQLLLFLFLGLSALTAQVVPEHYIVELKGKAPVEVLRGRATGSGRASVLRTARRQVRFEQRLLRKVLEHAGAKPFDSVDTVANALLVRMPGPIAQKVSTLPGVRHVYPVHQMLASLERAMPRHKVPDGWTRIGGWDAAGAGSFIAILDSGIDVSHPGFIDPSIPMPEGFPRVNRESDLAYTSNKVIVARSYLTMLSGQPDVSARDHLGHGTAGAMAAAGVIVDTASGPISGVAPKAYLGNYTIIGNNGTTRGDVVLKAMDDAVRDGADVINLSLGSPFAYRPDDTIFTRIVERLTNLGVVVVVAAGNDGPEPFTIADFASAPSSVAVGANWNDRTLSGEVRLSGGEQYVAIPGDGPRPTDPVSAPLFDIAAIDQTSLGCTSFPEGSLTGRIALISRGVCLFETKLNNAGAAGAVGALIYNNENPMVTMSVGNAGLPAVLVSRDDGLAIKALLDPNEIVTATMDFRVVRQVDPNRVASFSGRGPNTDFSIKPDLLATGAALNTATLSGGFDIRNGTSFSAPIVSGAIAVLKTARPGYSGHHYRSLLINAAAPLVLDTGNPAPVQSMGGGVLDLDASLACTTTAYPTSLSFGVVAGTLTRRLTISNLNSTPETYTITPQQFDGGPAPVVSETTLQIPPMSTRTIMLTLTTEGLSSNEYQGLLWIRGTRDAATIHVPYWYAIRSSTPAHLKIVWSKDEAPAGSLSQRAISIRVTDAAGVPISLLPPTVTAVSGGGNVMDVVFAGQKFPGLYEASVWLGPTPGPNVFRVEMGTLHKEVTIQGK